MSNLKYKRNGITLIALVVTIIVLLILAVVSFKIITGDDGIMNKAESSVSETEKAKAKEQVEMFISHQVANYYEQGHSGSLIDYLEDSFKTSGVNGVQIGDYFVKKKESGSARVDCIVKVASLGGGYATAENAQNLVIEVYKGNSTKKKFVIEGTIGVTGKVVWNEESPGENGDSSGTEEPETPEEQEVSVTKYTLTFNANEGNLPSGIASSKEIEENGKYGTLPTPTRDTYEFLGWFTDSQNGTEVNENTTISGNTTIYAHWELINGGKDLAVEWPNISATATVSQLKSSNADVVSENTILKDSTGRKLAVIPKGFKLASDSGETLEAGIVIEDSAGNQFVWVPVGLELEYSEQYKALNKGTSGTVELDRYFFGYGTDYSTDYSKNAGTDTREGKGEAQIKRDTSQDYYFLESTSQTVAKNLAEFIKSVEDNNGYYIGRYEAGTTTARNAAGNSLTNINVKSEQSVYNYVTRDQAKNLAQNMYTETYASLGVTANADLVNSYAWDTAVIYQEKCGTNNDYAHQDRGSNTSLLSTGQTGDVQCNIYDMAKNVREWTTEYCSRSDYSWVYRGGDYYSIYYTSMRLCNTTSASYAVIGFRPILYL